MLSTLLLSCLRYRLGATIIKLVTAYTLCILCLRVFLRYKDSILFGKWYTLPILALAAAGCAFAAVVLLLHTLLPALRKCFGCPSNWVRRRLVHRRIAPRLSRCLKPKLSIVE